jgi:hypothetical protein
MPSHHGVGEHERRAPVPPRLGLDDPEQISPLEMRTCDRPSQRIELLPEREILKDQFVVSAAGQPQRSDQYKDRLHHASILSF